MAVAAARPTPSGSTGAGCFAALERLTEAQLTRLIAALDAADPNGDILAAWIAKELLRCRIPADQVQAVLRLGSPGFPRRHSDPEDYLRRTLARALQTKPAPFSAHPFPCPLGDATTTANVHRDR